MQTITIKFDLPFSIRVDGPYIVNLAEENFDVILTTYYEPVPSMPGADYIDNVAILNDEGDSISHTVVEATYSPKNQTILDDPNGYMSNVSEIALAISNSLVAALRSAFSEYAIDYLYSASRLGPITCSGAINGAFDALQGGITFQTPSRSGSETIAFAAFLQQGAKVSVEQELYFDARRYLLRGNRRMALANLAISFEVRLARMLAEIAKCKGDLVAEQKIHGAALGELGQQHAKQMLGASLENRQAWGDQVVDTYIWIRAARNGVLHKANMSLTVESATKDFAINTEIKAFFDEHDRLVSALDGAALRITSRHSAGP